MNYVSKILLAVFIGASLSVLMSPRIIPMLRNLKIGQTIREDGPQSHISKTGTPTMGGIIFLASFLITVLFFGDITTDVLVIIISTIAFGFVGFMDDYIKVVKKRNLGLRAYEKIIGQLLASLVIIIYVMYISESFENFVIPGFGQQSLNLGILSIPLLLFVILGTVNAVNLTDGLDGLASGISIIVFLAFGVINNLMGNHDITIASCALVGSLIGFLVFNYKPAKIFMGDTGSLALGGALASIAILSGLTFFIPIVAGVFTAETISVILQVGYFKLTGKRLFRMAPIHHHFEQIGWSELKVVWIFWGISAVLAFFGIILI